MFYPEKRRNSMARRSYPTDLTDAQWALITRHFQPERRGGRPRQTDRRAAVDAIFYLSRTGCQWRMLPADFPPRGTVWWYFRRWRLDGVWVRLHRNFRVAARVKAGCRSDPTVVIMDALELFGRNMNRGDSHEGGGVIHPFEEDGPCQHLCRQRFGHGFRSILTRD
ncbi:transposase [uncultured Jannaschia sp.]|uniref:transposase n=1 Tax=uncultured Jannaschia sp. TaxID=293347 RepID=UPI003435861C